MADCRISLTSSYVEKWYKTAVRPSLTPLLFGPRRRAPHLKEIGKKNAKRAANKNPENLFDLDDDALSFATVHNRHLQPMYNLDEDKEDDESEGLAPAANPSPATPPRKNPNQEATRTNKASSATASLPSEEVEERDMRAADSG